MASYLAKENDPDQEQRHQVDGNASNLEEVHQIQLFPVGALLKLNELSCRPFLLHHLDAQLHHLGDGLGVVERQEEADERHRRPEDHVDTMERTDLGNLRLVRHHRDGKGYERLGEALHEQDARVDSLPPDGPLDLLADVFRRLFDDLFDLLGLFPLVFDSGRAPSRKHLGASPVGDKSRIQLSHLDLLVPALEVLVAEDRGDPDDDHGEADDHTALIVAGAVDQGSGEDSQRDHGTTGEADVVVSREHLSGVQGDAVFRDPVDRRVDGLGAHAVDHVADEQVLILLLRLGGLDAQLLEHFQLLIGEGNPLICNRFGALLLVHFHLCPVVSRLRRFLFSRQDDCPQTQTS